MLDSDREQHRESILEYLLRWLANGKPSSSLELAPDVPERILGVLHRH